MKKTIKIVKIGGNVINDREELKKFLREFSLMEGVKILVHGGGAVANRVMENMGLEPRMVDGRRITDEATMEVIAMVYAGLLNKKIVAALQEAGVNAIGLSGADGNVILAEKRKVKEIDYGLAGDIVLVNASLISGFLEMGLVPVFNSVVHNKKGLLLNTNADTIASEVAVALAEKYDVELIYVFEKKGVLSDLERETVIPEISEVYFGELQEKGVVNSGMIPKLHNCFNALSRGVKAVYITGKENFAKESDRGTSVV